MITVESDDWSEEKMLKALRERAKTAGASAVLVRGMSVRKGEGSFGTGTATSLGYGAATGSTYFVSEDIRRMEGLAIRYED